MAKNKHLPLGWGCPACGIRVHGEKWKIIKTHMSECCPQFYDLYTIDTLCDRLCNLRSEQCIVSGYEDWREQKRKEFEYRRNAKKEKKKKQREEEKQLVRKEQKKMNQEYLRKMSIFEWDKHNDKLNGGDYDLTTSSGLSKDAQDIMRPLLVAELDHFSDRPYGIQEPMGSSKENWKIEQKEEGKQFKKEQRQLKKEQKKMNREHRQNMNRPGWNKHIDKLNGGDYDLTTSSGLSKDAQDIMRPLLVAELDHFSDRPYGIQEPMGSKEDWIHWGLRLAAHPSQTSSVIDEHEKDIQLHQENLDTLGDIQQKGYNGCFVYIQALHCIFHDAFLRCFLPPPPLLNLEHAMRIRGGDEEFKNRMRPFNCYKRRAFDIVRVVMKNLCMISNVMNLDSDGNLPSFDAVPPIRRRILENVPHRGSIYSYGKKVTRKQI